MKLTQKHFRASCQNGGAGVAPVKCGVTPDFHQGRAQGCVWGGQRLAASLYGFGRDARNDRLEAGSTRRNLTTHFSHKYRRDAGATTNEL